MATTDPTDDSIAFIKVGGSLLTWPELPLRLADFLRENATSGVVLMVGGGGFADVVRDLYRCHDISETTAHTLALQTLDLSARCLAELIPNATLVVSLAEIPQVIALGQVPVLAPRAAFEEDERLSPEPLPRTWDTTSDSIAARLASLLPAQSLTLLKSTLPEGLTCREGAVNLGLVDPQFPSASRDFATVRFVNLRDTPPRLCVLS